MPIWLNVINDCCNAEKNPKAWKIECTGQSNINKWFIQPQNACTTYYFRFLSCSFSFHLSSQNFHSFHVFCHHHVFPPFHGVLLNTRIKMPFVRFSCWSKGMLLSIEMLMQLIARKRNKWSDFINYNINEFSEWSVHLLVCTACENVPMSIISLLIRSKLVWFLSFLQHNRHDNG